MAPMERVHTNLIRIKEGISDLKRKTASYCDLNPKHDKDTKIRYNIHEHRRKDSEFERDSVVTEHRMSNSNK